MKKIFSSLLLIILGIVSIITAFIVIDSLGSIGLTIFLIIGLLLLIVGGIELFNFSRNKKQKLPEFTEDGKLIPKYAKKSCILSKPERIFYEQLKNIIDTRVYDIFPQIALVSVIDKLTLASYRNELFRIADFCIVDKRTSEPLLLIELNDASHYKSERKARDEKVKDLCARAGIDIVTFSLEEATDTHFVSKTIRAYL
ncbi:MAG: DUF2726 domain-containing protein [Firmicutes bacterium]|nr:DUF2726 domain-containing protein [Bacillota bacterium]